MRIYMLAYNSVTIHNIIYMYLLNIIYSKIDGHYRGWVEYHSQRVYGRTYYVNIVHGYIVLRSIRVY